MMQLPGLDGWTVGRLDGCWKFLGHFLDQSDLDADDPIDQAFSWSLAGAFVRALQCLAQVHCTSSFKVCDMSLQVLWKFGNL